MSAIERSSGNNKASTATQERILDAAEALFVEKGFAATSVRAIADLAEVNLAAPNYHFSSKEGLLAATVHRRVGSINEARLTNLDKLESGTTPDLPEIIKAFLEPLIDSHPGDELPRLVARIYAEPESVIRPLLEKEFGQVAERFMNALGRVLPEVEDEELRWRFHFLIGAMLHVLNFPAPPGSTEPVDQLEVLKRLEAFVVAGLTQGDLPALRRRNK